MSNFIPGVPLADEYKGFSAEYVAKVAAAADPVLELKAQLQEVESLLAPLGLDKQTHRYAAEKWTVQEVLGHMIDTERIFAYRALRIARADETPLPGFDENLYAVAAESAICSWAELLDEFHLVRSSNVLMFRHFPNAAWIRRGISSNTPVTVRALAYLMLGHVAHHLDILRERYL
jgi:hypothetical protein